MKGTFKKYLIGAAVTIGIIALIRFGGKKNKTLAALSANI